MRALPPFSPGALGRPSSGPAQGGGEADGAPGTGCDRGGELDQPPVEGCGQPGGADGGPAGGDQPWGAGQPGGGALGHTGGRDPLASGSAISTTITASAECLRTGERQARATRGKTGRRRAGQESAGRSGKRWQVREALAGQGGAPPSPSLPRLHIWRTPGSGQPERWRRTAGRKGGRHGPASPVRCRRRSASTPRQR